VYKLTEKEYGLLGLGRFGLDTKELALISVFSSLWIVSQIYLGPVISQVTHIHGVIQRVMGWFLMLTLAELTGRFGRATAMAAIASLVTRIIRPGRAYAVFVGFGYALGGFIFDLFYFLPIVGRLKGKARVAYILVASAFSGVIALVPNMLFNLWLLTPLGFLMWIPFYLLQSGIKSVALSVLGTLIGVSFLPRLEFWSSKIRGFEGNR